MAIKEEEELKKILKKMDKRPFALSSVPNYGKDRYGREYGGFIKQSSYNKMKYRGNKSKSRLLFPEPKDEYEKYINENFLDVKKGPYEI